MFFCKSKAHGVSDGIDNDEDVNVEYLIPIQHNKVET